MFLRHLINPKPTIIIVFILIWLILVFVPLFNNTFSDLFQHEWMSSILICVLSIILPAFHAIGVNNLICEKDIIKKNNLVTGFIYIFLCTPFYNCISDWFISFFLLFYINYLFDSYQKENPLKQMFNSGCVLGILVFLYPNILLLALLVIISGINYENLSLRMIISFILGLFTPLVFYYMYLILLDKKIPYFNFKIEELMQTPNFQAWRIEKIIWLIVIGVTSMVSFFELFKWLYKKSIRSRKSFIIILFYFILTVVIMLFGKDNHAYYIISPLSIIIGNYFTYTKSRRFANFLFFALLISTIIYRRIIII